jgi:RNA polymerase subunit RPABC4/transcription elongation factor Spt4
MDLESILSTIQPFLIMFAALFAAVLTATWISVVIWTFRDIRARSRDIFAQILGTLMVLVFFPLFPLPGLAIYFILRPRETLAEIYERSLEEEALLQGIEERLACPGCNRRIEEAFVICPTCHTRLKKACPACGRLLHLRWNICPYCGAVQTAVKAVPLPVQPFSIAVEGPAEAPRIAEARPSALSEPADEAESEPYAEAEELEEGLGSKAHTETQELEEAEPEPYAEMQEAPGELEEPEENGEVLSSEPDSRWESGTLPLDFG